MIKNESVTTSLFTLIRLNLFSRNFGNKAPTPVSIRRIKSKLFGLLFYLSISIFLPSCKSLKDLDLKGIEKVRVQSFGLTESRLSFDMVFFNPNNHKLKLKKATGDAWLDGNMLGHFTVDTLIHIPANGDFRLPINLKMDMTHFLENISAALMDKQVLLKVDGMARAGKSLVFINYPLHYEGKQKLGQLLK